MYNVTTKRGLFKLERAVWEYSDELWPPELVLDLIDEIKRLRGWRICVRPADFQPEPPLKPVEFDFSGVEE